MAKRIEPASDKNSSSPSDCVRVLGVDPGLNITGYGLIDFTSARPTIVEAGTIRPNSKQELPARIAHLHSEIDALVKEFSPHFLAVEQLYSHYNHPRTSILMAHARGVIMLAAEQNGISVKSLASTQVKKSLTGNGHASKRQMQRTIQMVFNLPDIPEPPDVADALAIALCGGKTCGF